MLYFSILAAFAWGHWMLFYFFEDDEGMQVFEFMYGFFLMFILSTALIFAALFHESLF